MFVVPVHVPSSDDVPQASKGDEQEPPSAVPDSECEKRRLVVSELGNFCEMISRGLESALEGDDGAEVERLARQVRCSTVRRLIDDFQFLFSITANLIFSFPLST